MAEESAVAGSVSVSCLMGCRGSGFMNPGSSDAPRLAEVGLLCRSCFNRLHRDVVELPGLVEHLLAVGDSGQPRESGAGSGSGVPGSKVLYSQTLMMVDELSALLARLGLMIGTLRGVEVPGVASWWRGHNGEPLGVRSVDSLCELSAWVDSQLEWFAGRAEVGPFRRDLSRVLATARARWPQRERQRHLPQVKCERCGQTSLWYYPPSGPGLSPEIVCENLACGLQLSDSKWSARVSAIARAAGFGGEID